MPTTHSHHRTLPPHTILMLVLATVITVVLLFWAPSAGAVAVIDACGTEVAAYETAYLAADLDCRTSASEAVVLSHRPRLLMGGHSIVGNRGAETDSWPGVRCKTGTVCSVQGPGAIAGFSASGVAGTRVRLRFAARLGG